MFSVHCNLPVTPINPQDALAQVPTPVYLSVLHLAVTFDHS